MTDNHLSPGVYFRTSSGTIYHKAGSTLEGIESELEPEGNWLDLLTVGGPHDGSLCRVRPSSIEAYWYVA